jgi:F-type H+-transporting ATPase subunit a
MGGEGIVPQVIVRLGPVEVTGTVIYTLIVSAVIIVTTLVVRLGLRRRLSAWQIAAEFMIDHLEGVMHDMSGSNPRPYTPLVVTLALFIGVANLSGLVPGLHAPTADLSTTAALAVIVFLAVPIYGIRSRGLGGYLRHYLEPMPLLLPLEIFTELTRVLTLAVRLFGNVLSGELIIGVLVALVGLLVPIPVMLLEVLTGVIQAYIFAVLTIVYLSAAIQVQTN